VGSGGVGAGELKDLVVAPTDPCVGEEVTVTVAGTGTCGRIVVQWMVEHDPTVREVFNDVTFPVVARHVYETKGPHTLAVRARSADCAGTRRNGASSADLPVIERRLVVGACSQPLGGRARGLSGPLMDRSHAAEGHQVEPAISAVRGEVGGALVTDRAVPGGRLLVTARYLDEGAAVLKAAWTVGSREVTIELPVESWSVTPARGGVSAGSGLQTATAGLATPNPMTDAHEIVARMPPATELGEVEDLAFEIWLETEAGGASARKALRWELICRGAADCAEGQYCGAGLCQRLFYVCDEDDDSLLRGSDGSVHDCTPYACLPPIANCASTCSSVADCASDFLCTADGHCAPR
jgi:hypothetical protein